MVIFTATFSCCRNTLAELYPSKQLPAFPVNVLPNGSLVRDSSPTKPLYGSPTNSLTMSSVGRRSPNLDNQMDAIAEDCTEDPITPTDTPTDTTPPVNFISEPVSHLPAASSAVVSPARRNGGNGGAGGGLGSNSIGSSNSSSSSSSNSSNEPAYARPGRRLGRVGMGAGTAALLQIQQLANHVSSVLSNFGVPHVHQNNVFTVDHHGVRFQIHVAGNIQMQYVAGDMTQYQSLCSQLYSSLIPTTQ